MNNKTKYINKYNKSNYKMYQFRIKRSDAETIKYLDNCKNRNTFLFQLINNEMNKDVYTIKEIKQIIKPILNGYNIKEIYLFGSYARGEANNSSDIDIYCNKGNINTLIEQSKLEEELKNALHKDVDLIFIGSIMNEYFEINIKEDLIKLC